MPYKYHARKIPKDTTNIRRPNCYFKTLCTNGKHLSLATGKLIFYFKWGLFCLVLLFLSGNWHKISFFSWKPQGRWAGARWPSLKLLNQYVLNWTWSDEPPGRARELFKPEALLAVGISNETNLHWCLSTKFWSGTSNIGMLHKFICI